MMQKKYDEIGNWPFVEARKILDRIGNKTPEKGYVLFETGYGPSGLPHIGTFGEVVRTTMVMQAFQMLSDIPAKLIAFSDDMDALRKVPKNIPNQDMLSKYIGMPLTSIPDPYGKYPSFGQHNNAMLREFLDSFGFDYEFMSSTEIYKSGRFDDALLKALVHYNEIMEVMLPTLGAERQKTYSPFLPISPRTGKVLQVPIIGRDIDKGTVTFIDEDGEKTEIPVTGGNCKLQWKPDWGMRWYALGVDYEMSGQDLVPSIPLSSAITKILGSTPPQTYSYQLFMDENAQKISKSIGNGVSVEDWLQYAPPESLMYFMYKDPGVVKKLSFSSIPKIVDEYIACLKGWNSENEMDQLSNPAWYVHGGKTPHNYTAPYTYKKILSVLESIGETDQPIVRGYLERYGADFSEGNSLFQDGLVGFAIKFYNDKIKPNLLVPEVQPLSEGERRALSDLVSGLETLPLNSQESDYKDILYSVGMQHYGHSRLRDWFSLIYQVVLKKECGPRVSGMVNIFGVQRFIAPIRDKLNNPLRENDLWPRADVRVGGYIDNHDTPKSVQSVVYDIIDERPQMEGFIGASTLRDYFSPVADWGVDRSVFPYADKYIEIIRSEVARIHGDSSAKEAEMALRRNFVVNAGPHLCLPRTLDSMSMSGRKDPNTMNTLVFQSNILFSAFSKSFGNGVGVGLHTGKTALNYFLNGGYLQLSEPDDILKLGTRGQLAYPQMYIEAISSEELDAKRTQLALRKEKLGDRKYHLADRVLEKMAQHKEKFSDQICVGHDYLYQDVIGGNAGSRLVTIEAEKADIEFLCQILSDDTSLMHKIFSDRRLLEKFKESFSNIQTGWKSGEGFFTSIENGKISNRNIGEVLSPMTLVQLMKLGKIFPRNVLLQVALTIESGVLALGGMNQVQFGTEVKEKSVVFLREIGEEERADKLSTMPTDRAFLTPIFAVTNGKGKHLSMTSYDDYLSGAVDFSKITAEQILGIGAKESLILSFPALYRFLKKKPLPEKLYSDLQVVSESSGVVVVNRNPALLPREPF